MYLWYCTIPEHFSHKITFLWDTYYTNPTHKCSLNLSHWNFFNFEIFFTFPIFAKSIFSRNLKNEKFQWYWRIYGNRCPTEIFYLSHWNFWIFMNSVQNTLEKTHKISGICVEDFWRGDLVILIGNYPSPRAISEIFRARGRRPRARKISEMRPRTRVISYK